MEPGFNIFGGILGGIGQGLTERARRQDELKAIGLKGTLDMLSRMADNPDFTRDPAAMQDLTNAGFSAIADYTGHGEKVPQKPGGKAKAQDPLTHVRSLVGNMMQTAYPSRQDKVGQETTTGDTLAGAGPVRKGPFLTEEEKEQVKQRQARAESQILAEREITVATAKKRADVELETDPKYHNALIEMRKRDLAEAPGSPAPGTPEYNEYVFGIKPSTARAGGENAAEKVYLKEKGTGKVVEVRRDPKTGKIYNVANRELDASKFEDYEVDKEKAEGGDKGMVGELESAQGIMDDPTASKTKKTAAKLFLDNYKVGLEKKRSDLATGGAGAISDSELRSLAALSLITQRDPAFGFGKSGVRDRYNKIKAEIIGETGPAGAAEKQAEYKANTSNLVDLQKRRGQIVSFENTASANMDQVLKLSPQVGRTGSSLANEYLLWTQGKLTDYPMLSRYRTAIQTAANEYAKVVNSATGGGVTTDSARKDAQDLLNAAMAKGAIEGAIQQMKIDMQNRRDGLDSEINTTRSRMGGTAGGGGNSGSANDPLGILK